jgi:ABC-type branched-subunit amino acid transport system substrate-binding protein
MRGRTWRRLAAAGVLAALAAGCTSSPPDETTAAGSTAVGTGVTQGLTDDTIVVSFVGIDFGRLTSLGIAPDLGDQEKTVPAIVDDLNERGGIAGRKVELHVDMIRDVTDPDAARAACLAATDEDKPFVVLLAPAVAIDTARCTAAEKGVLTLSHTGWDDDLYREAKGRLFSLGSQTSIGSRRLWKAWAQQADEAGELDGKTVGVVVADTPGALIKETMEQSLLPELKRLGHDAKTVVVLPCPEGSVTCDQQQAAVQRLKADGVDYVFMGASTLAGANLVSAAAAAGYRPGWAAMGNEVTETVAKFFDGSKDEWDGAFGVGGIFLPDLTTPASKRCNQVVADRVGERYEYGSDAYAFTGISCILLDVLKDALDGVHGDLDQAKAIAAVEGLGEVPATVGPSGTLRKDKHDAGDYVMLSRYSAKAGKFVPIDGTPVRVPD